MKNIHKGKVLSEKEVLDNRSDAYEFIDFDKQETIEEAVKKYCIKKYSIYNSNDEHTTDFIAGAKWQKEKSYSQEEVEKLISLLKQTTEYEVLQSFRDKVEQFKKK